MPVTSLVPKHRGDLLELRIEGEAKPLRASFAHPFWVKRDASDTGHWIEARDLVSGELLETIDGGWRRIESVSRVEGQETVYNFTVANDHDYFVGETGFLVHNARCECEFTPAGGPSFPGISGPPGRQVPLNPGLIQLAEETVGAVGSFIPGTGHPIGACAEFDAANNAMNAGYGLEGGTFGPVTRGPNIIAPCPICQKMFGLIP